MKSDVNGLNLVAPNLEIRLSSVTERLGTIHNEWTNELFRYLNHRKRRLHIQGKKVAKS